MIIIWMPFSLIPFSLIYSQLHLRVYYYMLHGTMQLTILEVGPVSVLRGSLNAAQKEYSPAAGGSLFRIKEKEKAPPGFLNAVLSGDCPGRCTVSTSGYCSLPGGIVRAILTELASRM